MGVVIALEWVPVESKVFTAAAYRERAWQLYLRFCDGDVYRYFDVPASVYHEFLEAESKGRYFAQSIRNRYRDQLVHRNNSSGQDESDIAEQLSKSVLLTETRRVALQRNSSELAGVQD